MKVALIVGHSSRSQGAANHDGTTEYSYNDELAGLISERLILAGHTPWVVYRDTYRGLPGKVNELDPEVVVSLHCNAANRKASGSEVLHYHKSTRGIQLAEAIQSGVVSALGLRDRGLKPCTSEDRGGYLLKHTDAPCVIVEPFFIDNDTDLAIGVTKKDDLAEAIANGIDYYDSEYV